MHIFISGVTGFIKTNFAIMTNHMHPGSNSCLGSIAENSTKLIVKVRQFAKKFVNPYNVGEHVELLGRFQLESNNRT